jgi:hypothetical protein
MSHWSYIIGALEVEPIGRTQPEKRYVLDTVLEHLPKVEGSEGPMQVYVSQVRGPNCSSTCDEFCHSLPRYQWFETQDRYLLTVHAALRDCTFDEAYRQFAKWLTRLTKRIMVNYVCVKVDDYEKASVIDCPDLWHLCEPLMFYGKVPEESPNWCSYLYWEPSRSKSGLPAMLEYKYVRDKENDERVEAWMGLTPSG